MVHYGMEMRTIDGRTGWISRHDAVREYLDFAFPCGESQFGEVWCQVEIDTSSVEALSAFVASLD
jgi:hypothetical protein